MNKIVNTLMVSGFALALSAGTLLAAGPGAAGRQVNQQKRIGQGVRSGELTRAEARHLERNAAQVHRSIKRDRRDGGEFTPRERVKAQKKLNRQSKAIYRQKHDDQSRD
jgi:hypothetical protein